MIVNEIQLINGTAKSPDNYMPEKHHHFDQKQMVIILFTSILEVVGHPGCKLLNPEQPASRNL